MIIVVHIASKNLWRFGNRKWLSVNACIYYSKFAKDHFFNGISALLWFTYFQISGMHVFCLRSFIDFFSFHFFKTQSHQNTGTPKICYKKRNVWA